MSLTDMLSGCHVDVSMTPLDYLPAYPHSKNTQVSDGVIRVYLNIWRFFK